MSIAGIQTQFITPLPATNGTPTSNEAAARIEPTAGTLRAKILSYVRTCKRHGATDEEMQASCNINANTQRPRRQELEKLGWIIRSEHTRPTRSGRSAVVFVAVEMKR